MCCYVVATLSQSDQANIGKGLGETQSKGKRWVGRQWLAVGIEVLEQYVSPKHNSTHFTKLFGTQGERLTYVLS